MRTDTSPTEHDNTPDELLHVDAQAVRRYCDRCDADVTDADYYNDDGATLCTECGAHLERYYR